MRRASLGTCNLKETSNPQPQPTRNHSGPERPTKRHNLDFLQRGLTIGGDEMQEGGEISLFLDSRIHCQLDTHMALYFQGICISIIVT